MATASVRLYSKTGFDALWVHPTRHKLVERVSAFVGNDELQGSEDLTCQLCVAVGPVVAPPLRRT